MLGLMTVQPSPTPNPRCGSSGGVSATKERLPPAHADPLQCLIFANTLSTSSSACAETVHRQLNELNELCPFDVANLELRWEGLTCQQSLQSLERLMGEAALPGAKTAKQSGHGEFDAVACSDSESPNQRRLFLIGILLNEPGGAALPAACRRLLIAAALLAAARLRLVGLPDAAAIGFVRRLGGSRSCGRCPEPCTRRRSGPGCFDPLP